MKITRATRMILRSAMSLALLVMTVSAGFAAAVPSVTILGTITENLRAPGKIALNSSGMVYIADAQNRGILEFDGNGKFRGRIKVPGVVRGVASTKNGRIIVSHDNVVTMYNSAGLAVTNLSGFDFSLPNGITTDPAGNIYVVDSKAGKVAIFNEAGQFTGAFGTPGSQAGQLNFPTGIAYEKVSNQVAVADTLNNRVQFFDASGTFKRVIGSRTNLSGPLSFTYPQGIAFDYTSGIRMYVVDTYQSSVQAIDIEAAPVFLTYIGSYGFAEGQFTTPSDVAFDSRSQRLFVVDNRGVIAIFGIDGGKNPVGPAPQGLSLNPVPAAVDTAILPISGSVDPGWSVSVAVGTAAPMHGFVNGAAWNAGINLQAGDNVVTVTATSSAGKTATIAVAVTY